MIKTLFSKYNIWDHLLSEFIITTLARMLNGSGTLMGGVSINRGNFHDDNMGTFNIHHHKHTKF